VFEISTLQNAPKSSAFQTKTIMNNIIHTYDVLSHKSQAFGSLLH